MKKLMFFAFFILQMLEAHSQTLPLWRLDLKFVRENYPNETDSIKNKIFDGLFRIRESVSNAVLDFRVRCNPALDPITVYDTILHKYRSPEEVFNLLSTEVIMEIKPFETINNGEKIRPRNLFVSHKKGTKVFTQNYSKDTVFLAQYDKYYPFDDKILVYHDITKGYGYDTAVKILSGACDVSFFDIRPYNKELLNFTEPYFAAFFRLHRFGINQLDQLKQFYPTNNPQDTISWFRIDAFPLAKGHSAVVKVPTYDKFSNKYNYFDGIEVIFYECPLLSEGKGQGFWEVKYTFYNHPKSYEDTLPKYRKLAHEEILKMGQWYFETFIEPVIRYEPAPDEK